MDVSERQQHILQAIIEEFMRDASAVGSRSLVDRYKIGVSPATVRHEMVVLADKGYLRKSHSSSGRIPTDLGIRFFIQELMGEDPLPNTNEVQVQIRVFNRRFDEEKLMKMVLGFLSSQTGYAAVSLMDDTFRFRGISSLMDYEELRDIEIIDMILRVLESRALVSRIFLKAGSEDVCVLIGSESEIRGLEECAFIFSHFKYVAGKSGLVGVIGPRRMNYSRVIPMVRAVGNMVESAVRGW